MVQCILESVMQKIKISVSDSALSARIEEALHRSTVWQVLRFNQPAGLSDILVLDDQAFDQGSSSIPNPQRVVFISSNPENIAKAWGLGIESVVSDADPISTMLLAIMAAGLRHSTNFPETPKSGEANRPLPREEADHSHGIIIQFDPNLDPAQVLTTLQALADYYRACGGLGFKIDFETETAECPEPAYA